MIGILVDSRIARDRLARLPAEGPARAARQKLEARLGRVLAIEADARRGREDFDIRPV
jgi:hypothetical protein